MNARWLDRRVRELETELEQARATSREVAAGRDLEMKRAAAYLDLLKNLIGGLDLTVTGAEQSLAEIHSAYQKEKTAAYITASKQKTAQP